MNFLTLKRVGLLSLFLVSTFSISAQQRSAVRGNVTLSEDGRPLANVLVSVLASEALAITDQHGDFKLTHQRTGPLTLSFSQVGRKTIFLSIVLKRDTLLHVSMETVSLSLADVNVVARQRTLGSSNLIDGMAIRHLQPTSLADVLQLLPGQLAQNPSLASAQQVSLRQAATNSDAARANALGTAIVMDGIPISNNGNLQSDVNILNSAPGSLPEFSSVAGRGNDLRQIPADMIESVEVITGVPSARYGDLTSGGVIVKTRAGVFAPRFTTRINPLLLQQSIGMGFKLGRNGGILTIDNDLTYAYEDPRNTLSRYTRLGGQLTWSKALSKNENVFNTLRLGYSSTLDEQKQDPEDFRYQRKVFSRDQSFKLAENLKVNTNLKWLSSINIDLGITYLKQDSYLQELITRDLFPVTDRLNEGRHVARYGESEYLSAVTINGRPLSIYNRVEAVLFSGISPALGAHRLVAGWEYRIDQNHGSGRQFSPSSPPRQNYAMGDRPRSYSEIPSLGQIGYYLEDQFGTKILDRALQLSLGFRYDILQPNQPFGGKFGAEALPRLNLSYELLKDFRFKFGYGVTAKMPTLSYLYPGKRYFDLVNFNYYAQNPAERLVVMTTKIFDTTNESLRPFRSAKYEFGLDYQHKGLNGYVTFFNERVNGAFGTNREVSVVMVDRLTAESYPSGSAPVLSANPTATIPFYAGYDVSVNNRRIQNTGIEFQLSTPRIEAIDTRFILNGAWLNTTSFDNGESVDYQKAIYSDVVPDRVAVYQSGFGNRGKRLNTTVHFVTNISNLRFLISGLAQTVWFNSNRSVNLDTNPLAFIDKSGLKTYLTPSQAQSGEYADLRRVLSSTLSGTDKAPPLWLFNLRLTKEFRGNSSISFYVNNVIGDRGSYLNTITSSYVTRNQNFFFGAEFTINL